MTGYKDKYFMILKSVILEEYEWYTWKILEVFFPFSPPCRQTTFHVLTRQNLQNCRKESA